MYSCRDVLHQKYGILQTLNRLLFNENDKQFQCRCALLHNHITFMCKSNHTNECNTITSEVKTFFTVSPTLVTNTGAPQGCVLSPMLYTIYTNDCTTINSGHQMIKYADDTAIVGCMNSNDDSLQCFNHESSHFVEWCEQNYIEINVNKTK